MWQICYSFKHERDSVADLPHLSATVELWCGRSATVWVTKDSGQCGRSAIGDLLQRNTYSLSHYWLGTVWQICHMAEKNEGRVLFSFTSPAELVVGGQHTLRALHQVPYQSKTMSGPKYYLFIGERWIVDSATIRLFRFPKILYLFLTYIFMKLCTIYSCSSSLSMRIHISSQENTKHVTTRHGR